MKIILHVCLWAMLMCSCSNVSENSKKIKEAAKLLEAAAKSPENTVDIPFGFKLGWSEAEVREHIDSLKKKGTILLDSLPIFTYKYPEYKGLTANVELFFADNSLYRMAFQHSYKFENTMESTEEYKNLLGYLYNSGSKQLKYKIPIDNIEDEEYWDEVDLSVKDNRVVLFKRIKYSSILQDEKVYLFSNQPKAQKYPEYRTVKEIKEGEKRYNDIRNNEKWIKEHKEEIENAAYRRDVKNNSSDGSVWQVKEYLKQNLKDPRSYESIEWGNVLKTDNGYLVRHKYRAKNSFGGYTIENLIFYIDYEGNITGTLEYTN